MSRCVAFAFATTAATAGLGQTSAAPVSPPADSAEVVAAADQLAATAGAASAIPAGSVQPQAWAPEASAVSPPPPTTTSRLAKWIGVDPEDIRWLRLGTWEGNIGFSYYGSEQQTNSGTETLASRLMTETISIRNNGFAILDPRLVTGAIGVTLGFAQQRQTLGGTEQPQHGDIQGYTFDATAFGQKPLNARVWADREQGYSTLPFVGTLNNTISTAGVSLNLMQNSWLRDAEILPWFDAKLQAYRQHVLQEFNYGRSSASFDQTQDVVSLFAHNGAETSDLSGGLQYVDMHLPSFPQGAYQSFGGNVFYSGDYGADLGTTWTSAIAYNNRKGDIPLEMLNVAQTLDVHHYADVESTYTYNLLQQRSDAVNIVNQNASATFICNIWRHLSLTAGASGLYSRYPSGTLEGATGSLGLDYTRNLPGNGQVSANLQGSYAWAKDNLSSGEVSVVDEANSAPPTIGVSNGFLLANPYVVASSIVVVDTRGGARLPTAANVDYTIAPEGNKVRIVVLPTSRVIQPNDPLAISYVYAVPAEVAYHSSSTSVTLAVDYGWFGLNYNHTQTETPQLTQGAVTFVGNSTSDSVTGSLRWNSDALNAGFIANVQRFDSAALAYDTQSYSLGANWTPSWIFGLNFSSGWSKTDYTLPVARTSGASTARLDLNFYPPELLPYDVLTATIYGFRNRITDTMLATQTLSAVGANINYTLGKLMLVVSGQYGRFENGNARTNNAQFNLSLNRRF